MAPRSIHHEGQNKEQELANCRNRATSSQAGGLSTLASMNLPSQAELSPFSQLGTCRAH